MSKKESSVSELNVLMTGIAFGEAPRWHEDRLSFCDWGAPAPLGAHLALATPAGSPRHVADGVGAPSGLLVPSDTSALILSESYANRLTACDIAADGSLSNRRLCAGLDRGVPVGICLDAENAVWES